MQLQNEGSLLSNLCQRFGNVAANSCDAYDCHTEHIPIRKHAWSHYELFYCSPGVTVWLCKCLYRCISSCFSLVSYLVDLVGVTTSAIGRRY
jgi:hypothetical protein